MHRALAPQDDLDRSFAWRERTVTNTLTVQYDRVLFILEPSALTRPLARKKVSVFDYPDGRIEIRHQGLALPYRTFDRISRIDQGAIVENKRLSAALEMPRVTGGVAAEAAQLVRPATYCPGRSPVRRARRMTSLTVRICDFLIGGRQKS